jgi:hypothetical protein
MAPMVTNGDRHWRHLRHWMHSHWRRWNQWIAIGAIMITVGGYGKNSF